MKKIIILGLILVVMGLTACTSSDKEASVPVGKVEGKNEGTDKNKASTEETETEPTTESTSTEEQYITTGITIGDETLYINNCTYKELIKFLQKAGYAGTVDMIQEVQPGEHLGVNGKYSDIWVYNTTDKTQKAGDCKVSRLDLNIKDSNTITIVNGSIDGYMTQTQVEQVLNDLGITFESEHGYIKIKDMLPTGQEIVLGLNFDRTKGLEIYEIRLKIPQLLE